MSDNIDEFLKKLDELLKIMLDINKRVESLEKFEISSRESTLLLFNNVKYFQEEVLNFFDRLS